MLTKFRNFWRRSRGFNLYNRDKWAEFWATRIPEGSLILDVGAGTGRYRSLFAHCKYYAHDFGQEPSTIGKYTKLDYISDLTEIPVSDGSFDVILCTEVLEHVPEPVRALKEFFRILKPGGKLLLTAPLCSLLHQEPYHFYGGYTPYWYHKFLVETGFDVKRIEANQGFFSWFGQEMQRFSSYISPRKTYNMGFVKCILLSILWIIILPSSYIFPFLGTILDRLGLEHTATVGYHVLAIKKGYK